MKNIKYSKGFLLMLLIVSSSLPLYAYDCCVDGVYYNLDTSKQEASVTRESTSDRGYSGDLIIPSEIEYDNSVYTVTSIGSWAFYRCSGLTSVTIPNSVMNIDECAFEGCEGLTSVTIGNDVVSIGSYAFSKCSGLSSITIPNSVTSIGHNVFEDCVSLTSITIGNQITQIQGLCAGCKNLKSVVIPNSVTHIYEEAFQGCNSLKSFVIEDGDAPINVCGSIIDVVYGEAPMSYVYIGRNIVNDGTGGWHGWTFSEIGNIDSSTKIVIGQNVSELNEGLFREDSLTITSYAQTPPILHEEISETTVLNVPKGRTVQYATSQYWNNANKIYAEEQNIKYFPILLNDSQTNIVTLNGFAESIEVEENTQIDVSPTNIIERCFVIICNGRDYTDEILNNGGFSFVVSSHFKENVIQTLSFTPTEVTVHVGGTLINEVGIENLESIKFLKIKGDINGTDILTIRKMTNLSLLDMEDANIVDGGQSYFQQYVTSANTIGSYFFNANTNLTKIVLPNTVTKIGYNAFRDMTNLCSIAIPKSVVEIERDAFTCCSGLKSLFIEGSKEPLHFADEWMTTVDQYRKIEYLYMGRNVESSFIAPFFNMNELKQLIIGEEVTTIHEDEFRECISLERLYLPNGVTSIGKKSFSGCKALKWIYVSSSLKTISFMAFLDCINLKEVHISDLRSWCNIAFANNTSNPLYYAHHIFVNGIEVTELTDLYNIEKVSSFSFYGCNGLNSIYIENSTKSIGISAFESCNGISSAYIGNCVLSMGNSVFRNCVNLSSVRLSDNVTVIDHSTFEGCSNLSDVCIGLNTTLIDDSAFRNCKSLISIVIPNSVKEIRSGAFYGCLNIEDLTLGTNVEIIENEVFYNCDNLKTIYTYNTCPPEITISTFSDIIYQNAVLYVPKDYKTLYWLHPYWEKFKNINELEVVDTYAEKKREAESAYEHGEEISTAYWSLQDDDTSEDMALAKHSDNKTLASEMLAKIDALKNAISLSDMNEGNKQTYLGQLTELESSIGQLKEENNNYQITFNECKNEHYKAFKQFLLRLDEYNNHIEEATTIEELNAIISDINADNEDMENNHLNPVIEAYNELQNISNKFNEIGDELQNYLSQLETLTYELGFSDIITIINDLKIGNSDIVDVITIYGNKFSMNRNQVKSLPKGIYVVNGKKILIR